MTDVLLTVSDLAERYHGSKSAIYNRRSRDPGYYGPPVQLRPLLFRLIDVEAREQARADEIRTNSLVHVLPAPGERTSAKTRIRRGTALITASYPRGATDG